MERREMVLTALAAGQGAQHTPVQVQKLLFLLDRNVTAAFEGPHFDFRPYSYGPFDRAVYDELEAAASEGLVKIIPNHPWRTYALTEAGQEAGDATLNELDAKSQQYIRAASDFVRTQSFADLVSAIYKKYPEMRANSVFQAPE